MIKFLDPKAGLTCVNGLPLKLARKCIDVYGSSLITAATDNNEAGAADGGLKAAGKKPHQVEVGCDDDVVCMQTGKEFALMLNSQGKVLYSGKSSSIGQKQACPPGTYKCIPLCCIEKLLSYIESSQMFVQCE